MSEIGEVPVDVVKENTKSKPPSMKESLKQEFVDPYVEEFKKIKTFLMKARDSLKESLETSKEEKVGERYKEQYKKMITSEGLVGKFFKPQYLVWYGLSTMEGLRETVVMGKERYHQIGMAKGEAIISSLPASMQEVLTHVGDLWDGYTASMLTYYGLSLVSGRLKTKIPEKAKVAVAFLTGSAVVFGAETGLLTPEGIANTVDWADIPAGVVGALIFAGVVSLNNRFIKDCDKAIENLESEIESGAVEPTIKNVSKVSVKPAV